MHLYAEGILQAKEALGIYQWHDHASGQADCWKNLARLSYEDGQLEAAEEAALRAIDLLLDQGDPVTVFQSRRVLGDTCHPRDDTGKVTDHFQKGLGIAASFGWQAQQF